MYCPKCAAPIDGVKYCRSCGANVSLVPQALTGNLPAEPAARQEAQMIDDWHGRHRGRRYRPPSLAKGIQNVFVGVGFLFVSMAVYVWAPAGETWWFWMLIPAFSTLGSGVAEIVRAKQEERRTQMAAPAMSSSSVPPAPRVEELPPRDTSRFTPPSSVTETTTRHLDKAAERTNESV